MGETTIPYEGEESKFNKAAIKWLYEMEFLASPNLQANIIENIYLANFSVKDVEVLIDRNQKKMLVYIKLTFWANLFKKETVIRDVESVISKLLPSFQYRITTDIEIFNLALSKTKEFIYGKSKKDYTI